MQQPFWYNYYEYFYEMFVNCPDTEEFHKEKVNYYENLQSYRKNFSFVYEEANFLDFEATFGINENVKSSFRPPTMIPFPASVLTRIEEEEKEMEINLVVL